MKTKSSILTVILISVGFIFSLHSCTDTKLLTPSELEGYWVLKSMNGKDAKDLFSGALPTISFDFSAMQISGTGGCNRYNGTFTFENNVLKAPNIASTRMLCFDENAEPQFFIELAKDNKLSIVNGTLTFTNRDKEIAFEFEKTENMEESPETVTAEVFEGDWLLTRIEGAKVDVVFQGENAKIPTLKVDLTEKRIGGNTGCNSYSAPFSLRGNSLVVMPLATTQMACPNLDGESKYLSILEDTLVVSLPNPDVLMLIKGNQTVLEFKKR